MSEKTVKRILLDHGEAQTADLGPHPDLPELCDYKDDLLSQVETDRLRHHLTYCPKCRDSFLMLDDPANFQAGPPAPMIIKPGWFRPNGWTLVAAALLLAAVTLTLLPQSDVGLRGNPHLASLIGETEGQQRGPAQAIFFPADAPRLTLLLTLAAGDGHTSFSAEITPPKGEDLKLSLTRKAEGYFTLELDRHTDAGPYLIRLYGVRGEQRDLLQSYRFELAHE